MHRYHGAAKLFQALSHPVRLQILEALVLHPLCVCDLVELTGRRQAYISQHLALLRSVGLVFCERTGWNVYYRLNPTRLADALQILQRTIISPAQVNDAASKMIGDDQMSEKNNNQWHGIPRSEIDWYPTIINDRCVGCGMCATSCGRGVYAFDYEQNRPVVVAPEMCMVGCTTCATICTQDAIEFPSTGYIRQIIRQNKLLRHSKDTLRSNREKYDVRVR